MARQYFALDLKDDQALIAEYERWHRSEHIWPDVVAQLRAAGIGDLEIFRCGNRLVMALDAPAGFVPADPLLGSRAAQWESLMWRFQQALPFADAGQKWVPMQRVFSLQETSQKESAL